MTNSSSKTIKQWIALNGMLKTAKIVAVTQAVVILLLTMVSLNLYFKDPLVVLTDGNTRSFVTAKRKPQDLSPQDIERYVKDFISLKYEWNDFEPMMILERIRPYVKEGFYDKLLSTLKKDKSKAIKGKSIRQTIADVKVKVEKDAVFASFFKILIIEGIPLPIKTEIAFQLAKGATSAINPFGIYVNGVVEHNEENK